MAPNSLLEETTQFINNSGEGEHIIVCILVMLSEAKHLIVEFFERGRAAICRD